MLNLFKKKAAGAYDTEYFRNKVKIDELEEKLKVQQQRQKIAKLQKKVKGSSNNIGLAILGSLQDFSRPPKKSRKLMQDPFMGGGVF